MDSIPLKYQIPKSNQQKQNNLEQTAEIPPYH